MYYYTYVLSSNSIYLFKTIIIILMFQFMLLVVSFFTPWKYKSSIKVLFRNFRIVNLEYLKEIKWVYIFV